MTNLIALCGLAGSGKDTAAEALVAKGWKQIRFADPIRDILLALDLQVTYRGCSLKLNSVIRDIGWDAAKREIPYVRHVMQRIGDEAGRQVHGDDVWVNIAVKKYLALRDAGHKVVISDCRYANEAQAVRNLDGAIVLIKRDGVTRMNHPSEALDFAADVGLYNSGTVEQLHSAIVELAESR